MPIEAIAKFTVQAAMPLMPIADIGVLVTYPRFV